MRGPGSGTACQRILGNRKPAISYKTGMPYGATAADYFTFYFTYYVTLFVALYRSLFGFMFVEKLSQFLFYNGTVNNASCWQSLSMPQALGAFNRDVFCDASHIGHSVVDNNNNAYFRSQIMPLLRLDSWHERRGMSSPIPRWRYPYNIHRWVCSINFNLH